MEAGLCVLRVCHERLRSGPSTSSPGSTFAILNAGVNSGSFARNQATGHEEELQTNNLSAALLVLNVVMWVWV